VLRTIRTIRRIHLPEWQRRFRPREVLRRIRTIRRIHLPEWLPRFSTGEVHRTIRRIQNPDRSPMESSAARGHPNWLALFAQFAESRLRTIVRLVRILRRGLGICYP
jgi:hypothetical protein